MFKPSFNSSDIPNLITLARILLVGPVVYALLREEFALALGLFFIAGVSDGVDGFLAKHYHWQSRLGSLLDPLADKLLLVSSSLSLAWLGLLPWWLVAAVLLRDLIIVGGALWWNFNISLLEAEPTIVSKINTFMQIVLVLAVVLAQLPLLDLLPEGALTALIWATLATTLSSGIDYVWEWSKRAREAVHGDAKQR
ncbi:MAG: CDP-alcohol phosphatidyltransferase family protein [Gammaproteobacteria bacterium SHHR-1]|uniref:CDP-alcohol phosphatidyltransferase family protein n=1 Tax=Magnetovirga frankeli TaxID=947516 RepID=UPI0012941379|nr:CDP-alcohol phosphatidyltransferase family protein [gamma proteobacterium SS-5]